MSPRAGISVALSSRAYLVRLGFLLFQMVISGTRMRRSFCTEGRIQIRRLPRLMNSRYGLTTFNQDLGRNFRVRKHLLARTAPQLMLRCKDRQRVLASVFPILAAASTLLDIRTSSLPLDGQIRLPGYILSPWWNIRSPALRTVPLILWKTAKKPGQMAHGETSRKEVSKTRRNSRTEPTVLSSMCQGMVSRVFW